jgi:hypothetical protein
MMQTTSRDKFATIFAGLANTVWQIQSDTGLSREEVLAQNPILAGQVLLASQIQSILIDEIC